MWTKRMLKWQNVAWCGLHIYLSWRVQACVVSCVGIAVAVNVLLLARETEVCFLFCRWDPSVEFADVLSSEKLILNAMCWPTQVTVHTPAHTATSPATVEATFIDTSAVLTPHCSPPNTSHTLTNMFTGPLLPPLPRSICSPDNESIKATTSPTVKFAGGEMVVMKLDVPWWGWGWAWWWSECSVVVAGDALSLLPEELLGRGQETAIRTPCHHSHWREALCLSSLPPAL